MPSGLSWLDHDATARERSHRLLEMFKESETRDELGIGSIRDSIADLLFPGTSVIQTRLRYVLLVPWLFMQLEDRHEPAAKFPKLARQAELELGSRLAKTDQGGVFGKSAGDQLKRLASSVYWAGLGTWEIRKFPGTQQEYFRRIESVYAARSRRQKKDDGEWLDPHRGTTWHPALAGLLPSEFADEPTLQLSREEAQFIREQWRKTHPDSLLAWLAYDKESLEPSVRADAAWLHPRQAAFPLAMQRIVTHGHRFSHLMLGAALVYNLRLSEVDGRAENVERYRAQLAAWSEAYPASGLADWALDEFWLSFSGSRHAISTRTRAFVTEWLRILKEASGMALGVAAANKLVERREQDMKGSRSRFTNAAARKPGGGSSGLTPVTYRWGITQTFLQDLATGLTQR